MEDVTVTQEERLKYSKLLSSLFCSMSIVTLSILSLLNTLSLDIYSMVTMLKVVLPASACFWIIGFVIGKILDSLNTKIIKEEIKAKIKAEAEPYEIPSMFSGADYNIDESDMRIV